MILYILLFFRRSTGSDAPQAISYSITAEIAKILLFLIPSLILVMYFRHKHWNIKQWIKKPSKNDLISGLIAFPCLIIIGILMALLAANTGSAQVPIHPPSSITGWFILTLFCLLSAWLEEGFFRSYLISKKDELKLSVPSVLFLSTALFSICHLYSFPFGFLNSIISGLILGILFIRFKSLYGITIAHGLYNLTSYILIALI